jgi:hypothetical protein
VVALALVALPVWLTLDLDVAALESPHDDESFLRRAECGYWFDQGYTHMTFIKEPIYPLFAWVCYCLGIPLRLATEGVYLLAAGLFSWSLVRRHPYRWVGLVVFGACVLHPMRFAIFQQTTSDTLYPSLLLLALAALFVQVQDGDRPGRFKRGFSSGLALGLLWNTRPERPLTALLVLFFLGVGFLQAWRRAATWKTAIKGWLAEWALPPAVLTAITLAIMTANQARFGIFAITDLGAPGYWSAHRALVSIRPEQPIRYVPVTREMRRRASAVSPSFRQVERYLEGKVGKWYAWYSRGVEHLPDGEIAGGWFWWAVRDAVAASGHGRSAADSEAFYRQIADELDAAARDGRLATRAILPFGLNPDTELYVPHVPASAARLLARCWSAEEPPPLKDHPTDIYKLFDAVAHRRSVPAQPTLQSYVRSRLWSLYGPLMSVVLLAGGLIAAAVLMRRSGAAGLPWYFFAAAALGLAGFSRIGLFALIDASTFAADALRYLFPAALLLSLLAAWLAVEGLRLFCADARTAAHPNPRCGTVS